MKRRQVVSVERATIISMFKQSSILSFRRRWFKWAGLVPCIILVIVWVWSIWFVTTIAMPFSPPRTQYGFMIWRGSVSATGNTSRRSILSYQKGVRFWYSGPWKKSLWDIEGMWGPAAITYDSKFPLWIPILLLAAPTGWLWWRDWYRHRFPKDQCQRCGYLLIGLTSQKCPECGSKLRPEQRNLPV